jgi:NO-binding membrane sensor protein with MHYT domain
VLIVPVVHQFAYGPVNPVVAYCFAATGSLLGLMSTALARQAPTPGSRRRWLLIAAFAIGGPGIWLMHFMAMIGFDLPASTIRYNIAITLASLVIAIAVVACGLFIVGSGTPSAPRIVAAGTITGLGVAGMHYTGMAAVNFNGSIGYDPTLVAASVLVAVVASTVALWFTVTVRESAALIAAAAIMGVAVTGMHYTGMAAVHVHLGAGSAPVRGVGPLLFLVPILIITTMTIVGLFTASLNLMSYRELRLVEQITTAPEPHGSWSMAEPPRRVLVPLPVPRSSRAPERPRGVHHHA